MSQARELLEIATEYVQAKRTAEDAAMLAPGAEPLHDLDEIAGRFEMALNSYAASRP